MKKICTLVLCVFVCPALWAGVVIEMEVRDPGSTGEVWMDRIYAQGEMLRMDLHPQQGQDSMSMIFRDDTLWMVNHKEKSCQTIDKKSMEQISSQLGAAMKQMETELSKLPPEQRAMVEKMMKERMPAGMSGLEKKQSPRRLETGATEQVGQYSCVVHTLYSGDEKIWEACATSKSQLSDASEAVGAFEAMSRFTRELQDQVKQGVFSNMIDTPFHDMDEIDGFPVRVRTFDNGQAAIESTLKSVTRRDLGESDFSPPNGFKVENLADLIKRGE